MSRQHGGSDSDRLTRPAKRKSDGIYVDPQDRSSSRDSKKHPRKRRTKDKETDNNGKESDGDQGLRDPLSMLPIPKPTPDKDNGRRRRHEIDRMAEYNGLMEALQTPIRGKLVPLHVQLDFDTNSENGKVNYKVRRTPRYGSVIEMKRENTSYEKLYEDVTKAVKDYFDEESRHKQGKIIFGQESTDESEEYSDLYD